MLNLLQDTFNCNHVRVLDYWYTRSVGKLFSTLDKLSNFAEFVMFHSPFSYPYLFVPFPTLSISCVTIFAKCRKVERLLVRFPASLDRFRDILFCDFLLCFLFWRKYLAAKVCQNTFK
ncbi:hypothetical protein CDAR_49871 [Caerostris darwini]|uniref:Uncharacterized protein n=1 Tax=Caerostris darwini TaxID=1538125 RepID=A0AAV4UHX1_9ARAC|nr:hypothetical protein CDAR_49871 [Caerostris darwini]